eukprot:6173318-Pleurochrysis_carterae.AAC.1
MLRTQHCTDVCTHGKAAAAPPPPPPAIHNRRWPSPATGKQLDRKPCPYAHRPALCGNERYLCNINLNPTQLHSSTQLAQLANASQSV